MSSQRIRNLTIQNDATQDFKYINKQYPNINKGQQIESRIQNEDNIKFSSDNKYNNKLIKKRSDDDLIIDNLEKELKEKNEEIKLLKKNFIEKIDLVENENKVIVNQLEEEFKRVTSLINKNYENNLNGLNVESLEVKNNYDEFLARLNSTVLDLKNNTVDAKKHEKIIQDLKTRTFIKIEEEKNNYDEKLRELLEYFDRPDYRKLINNINFYIKFKEKINFTNDDLNYIENLNFTDQEHDLWMDRIKLNVITAECDYINGVINLENEYKILYEKLKYDEEDKLKSIENEIIDKFEHLEKFCFLNREKNTIISNSPIYRDDYEQSEKTIMNHFNDVKIQSQFKKRDEKKNNSNIFIHKPYFNLTNEFGDTKTNKKINEEKINSRIKNTINDDSVFKTFNQSENEINDGQNKNTVNAKINDHDTSKMKDKDKLGNSSEYSETRDLKKSYIETNKLNLKDSQSNLDFDNSDDDDLDFGDDEIKEKKINSLSEVHILTNHK